MTTIDLMHGPHYAKSYVTSYLESDLPGRLNEYRNGWSVDDITLPDPIKYLSYEPIALDDWPTIITVAISTTGFERIGWDRQQPIYRVGYSMRTYVWVRTEGNADVTLMRDRLTTVVRSSLMDHPTMRAVDPRGTFRVVIEESSIREEFSDLTLLKGDRVLAGAYVGYDMNIDEIIMRRDIADISEINTTVEGFGVSQELPDA
jgi:hypothetical protein